MKNLTAAIFFAALLSSPTHSVAGPWPNEPAGSRPLLDCPFDNLTCGDQLWTPVSGSIAQPAEAPLSSPNAMAQRLPINSSHADGSLYWPKQGMGQQMSDIYVGVWWKMNKEFQGYANGSNKLIFVRSFNYTFGTMGTNSLFVLKGSPDKFPWQLVFAHNSSAYDNSHVCADDLGLTCWPNVSSVPIYRDTWYKIEIYMKSSTCSTCRDGTARWWINGTLAGNYTNLNNGSGVMNEVVLDHTWDGQGAASCYDPVANPYGRDCSREWIHYFDHLYVSAPNCGPSGCAAPPYLVITSSLSSARTGTPYSATLSADGGTKPYSWIIESGILPSGLTLNKSTGIISGLPTCVGRSDFTVRVTDGSSPALSATKAYSLVASGTGTPCSPTSIGFQQSTTKQSGFAASVSGNKVNFRLPANDEGDFRISIFDLSGKKVFDKMSGGQNGISVGVNFKNGVYIARLLHGSKVESTRFQVVN